MEVIKNFWARLVVLWQDANRYTKAVIIFIAILLGFMVVYLTGNSLMKSTTNVNTRYTVARVTPFKPREVAVKKFTDSWATPATNADNVTNIPLSVGQQVGVKSYWWFGQHTIVTEVPGK